MITIIIIIIITIIIIINVFKTLKNIIVPSAFNPTEIIGNEEKSTDQSIDIPSEVKKQADPNNALEVSEKEEFFYKNEPSASDDQSPESVDNEETITDQLLNILTLNKKLADPDFVLEMSKNKSHFYKKDIKENCKIVKFSSDWNIEEILSTIASLNTAEFPLLFAFVIQTNEFKSNDAEIQTSNLTSKLLEFSSTRPLIAQVSSEEDSVIFFKYENSKKFQQIKHTQTSYEKIQDFPSFLYFINKADDVEDILLDNIQNIQNLSLILRYLRIFDFSEGLIGSLELECAKHGSLNCLLSILDASFESFSLNLKAQSFLSCEYKEDQLENELDDNHDDAKTADVTELNSNSCKDNETQPTSDIAPVDPSVLLTAIENSNDEIVQYLTSRCSHLIQELPFEHQIAVSTAAFKSNQLDVLCDLLELSDYPFPQSFKINEIVSNHERLLKIAEDRTNFELNIKEGKLEEVSKFVDENLHLKYIYTLSNKSAMHQAVEFKKFDVYYHLHSLGLKASEFDDLEKVLKGEELKKSKQFANKQRMKNVNKSIPDELNSVNLLCTRSFIHNRKISKEQERIYRSKIRAWYEDISKIRFGPEFLDAVSSCDQIKIIFDFENCDVNRVSLGDPNAAGSTYPISKWIFIGAKESDKNGEQYIKGVIAHEMCHYLMRLVYENNEEPYYKHDKINAKIFKEIVEKIDQWSKKIEDPDDDDNNSDHEDPDDGCNGIISSVYKYYHSKDYPPELIVIPVQILAQFWNDEDKSQYLQGKYNILFDFWKNVVMPEIRKFNLKNRQMVRSLNKAVELLKHVSNQELKLADSSRVDEVITKSLIVIKTNVPCLLLVNIYNCLKDMYENLLDARNIFIEPKHLNNSLVELFYDEALKQDQSLNVIVDCSNEINGEMIELLIKKLPNCTFIVSNSDDADKLIEVLKSKSLNPAVVDIDYSWNDLDEECKQSVLQQKVNFQNNCSFSILDLLTIDIKSKSINETVEAQSSVGESNSTLQVIDNQTEQDASSTSEIVKPGESALEKFSEMVDCKILNLLVEKKEITINSGACAFYSQNDETTRYFEQLYQPRKLIKKLKTDDESSDDEDDESNVPKPPTEVSQDQLLSEVENKKYVLISDIAGTGKSWMMKFVSKIFCERIPKTWTTYVDLKQFIEEFMLQKEDIIFETFMVDKVLKPEYSFEGKFFTQLYKDGKVCILFDGFDELPETSANFVIKLIKSFAHNDGNQMWISTRDHFEVNLQESLGLEEAYRFEELTNKTGINLIASSWVLYDFEQKKLGHYPNDLTEQNIKNDPNYKSYQAHAKKLLKRFGNMKQASVGYPDFCKFIAEYFKNNKEPSADVTPHSLYEKIGDYQSKRAAPRESATGKNYKF